jgi:hypothetical protein
MHSADFFFRKTRQDKSTLWHLTEHHFYPNDNRSILPSHSLIIRTTSDKTLRTSSDITALFGELTHSHDSDKIQLYSIHVKTANWRPVGKIHYLKFWCPQFGGNAKIGSGIGVLFAPSNYLCSPPPNSDVLQDHHHYGSVCTFNYREPSNILASRDIHLIGICVPMSPWIVPSTRPHLRSRSFQLPTFHRFHRCY